MSNLLISFVISFGLLIVAMSVHEFAHGWTAYKLGDMTAKYSGRLTLNPLAHIDPFWTLLLPLILFISTAGHFVFGAAKPVPINYWSLKNPRRDMFLIALSGPLSNFIFALLLAQIVNAFAPPAIVSFLMFRLILINVVLGVFNLIPIPPLDGSRIFMSLLPESLADRFSRLEPVAFIILLALLWMGAIDYILWPVVGFILRLLRIGMV
ncbi:MAG: site-2 protease family protein [Candidatus Omnitrophica bacterium]|nr:site-2 protease family protein [Candidatus Omnitrophota bacterium]